METTRKQIQINVNEHIILREICLDDAKEVFDVIDKEREYLGKWLPFVQNTKTINDTVDFITYSLAAGISMKEYVFKILFRGRFAGLIGFRNADNLHSRIELGYWLGEHFQHLGIISQSVTVLCGFMFEHTPFTEILIKCAVENHKSRKIPERSGFSYDRTENQSEQLSDGSFTDVAVYTLKKNQSFNK